MDLNHAIDQARRTKGLKWGELQQIMRVSEGTLTNIRYGRTNPRSLHVDALEDALGWTRGQYWLHRNGATPTTDTATALEQAIDQERRAKGWSKNDVARLLGVHRKTFTAIERGTAGEKSATALEELFGWERGQYTRTRDTGQLPPELTPPPTPPLGDQLRMVGHAETTHGTLTWVEHPGQLRDYTLAREIHGVEQGVSTKGSTLSPAEATEDLAVSLSLLEQMLNAQQHSGEL